MLNPLPLLVLQHAWTGMWCGKARTNWRHTYTVVESILTRKGQEIMSGVPMCAVLAAGPIACPDPDLAMAFARGTGAALELVASFRSWRVFLPVTPYISRRMALLFFRQLAQRTHPVATELRTLLPISPELASQLPLQVRRCGRLCSRAARPRSRLLSRPQHQLCRKQISRRAVGDGWRLSVHRVSD